MSVKQAAKNGGQVQKEVFKEQGCDEKCIEAQVIKGHEDMGIDKDTKVKHVSIAEQEKYADRLIEVLDGDGPRVHQLQQQNCPQGLSTSKPATQHRLVPKFLQKQHQWKSFLFLFPI